MQTLTIKELETFDFYLIGDSDREKYYPAIIGLAKDKNHIAYSRERLVECYMKANNWTYDEAEEWIEYNVERSLPYYNSEGKAPVILNNNFISSRNKKYDPIKISLTK